MINGHSGPSNGVATPGAGDVYTTQNGASTSAGATVNGYAQ